MNKKRNPILAKGKGDVIRSRLPASGGPYRRLNGPPEADKEPNDITVRRNGPRYRSRLLRHVLSSLLLAFCSLLIYGCGGPEHYIKPKTDISNIKRVAVLPIENFTSDEYAGEKVRRVVITELLSRGIDVIEPGEVTRVLKESNIRSLGSIKVTDIQNIGKTLGVESVMIGSVEAFGISRGISVSYPEVTINLILLEASSGNIIWSVRNSAGGASFWTRHFGSEGITLSEAVRKAVKEAVGKTEEMKLGEFEQGQRFLMEEMGKLQSELKRLTKERDSVEGEREELKDRVKRYEEALKYMTTSSSVLRKLAIKEVPWRTGNFYEDFLNEHILYGEAKRLNITGDIKKQKGLVEKYNLEKEEGDCLFRYLAISELLDRKLKDLPGERVVESLLIRYTKEDELDKAVLAAELQRDTNKGRSFEDIYKSYPDVVRLTLIGFQQLQGWVKDSAQLLQDGEFSNVLWTEEGYMILRPSVEKLSYRPFEDIMPEIRDKIRTFIKGWVEELRKGAKEYF